MICPECDGKTKVVDSRVVEENVFRIRKCVECGYRFCTEELLIDDKETERAYYAALKRRQRGGA